VPVRVTGLTGVTAITAGYEHTCALLSGGTVDCWGWNDHGQLGDETSTYFYNDAPYFPTPVEVSGLTGVMAISSTGDVHTCALLIRGAVECFGQNYWGELGDGTTTDSSTPVQVLGLP
jgi:alpha-tubulin suppressor-like RCC1 family protein